MGLEFDLLEIHSLGDIKSKMMETASISSTLTYWPRTNLGLKSAAQAEYQTNHSNAFGAFLKKNQEQFQVDKQTLDAIEVDDKDAIYAFLRKNPTAATAAMNARLKETLGIDDQMAEYIAQKGNGEGFLGVPVSYLTQDMALPKQLTIFAKTNEVRFSTQSDGSVEVCVDMKITGFRDMKTDEMLGEQTLGADPPSIANVTMVSTIRFDETSSKEPTHLPKTCTFKIQNTDLGSRLFSRLQPDVPMDAAIAAQEHKFMEHTRKAFSDLIKSFVKELKALGKFAKDSIKSLWDKPGPPSSGPGPSA